jgi:molybdopterin synthase catalytic subunit
MVEGRAGACVTFSGHVRVDNENRKVSTLGYEAYEAMARIEGMKILDEARAKFGLLACRAVHRTGLLAIGEMAVWIEAWAGHRDEAFQGARFVIEALKARVPIWKRETYSDDSHAWVKTTSAHDKPRGE